MHFFSSLDFWCLVFSFIEMSVVKLYLFERFLTFDFFVAAKVIRAVLNPCRKSCDYNDLKRAFCISDFGK